ncbi:hypothetical protein JX266_004850 [Neoarthrinium moseri]|nr:hypothetical protein JX266_004850 [Neoarthrinium moseri]
MSASPPVGRDPEVIQIKSREGVMYGRMDFDTFEKCPWSSSAPPPELLSGATVLLLIRYPEKGSKHPTFENALRDSCLNFPPEAFTTRTSADHLIDRGASALHDQLFIASWPILHSIKEESLSILKNVYKKSSESSQKDKRRFEWDYLNSILDADKSRDTYHFITVTSCTFYYHTSRTGVNIGMALARITFICVFLFNDEFRAPYTKLYGSQSSNRGLVQEIWQTRSRILDLVDRDNKVLAMTGLIQFLGQVAMSDVYTVICQLNVALERLVRHVLSKSPSEGAGQTVDLSIEGDNQVSDISNQLTELSTNCFHLEHFLSYTQSKLRLSDDASMKENLHYVRETVAATKQRIDGFTQTLMSTMSIIESQKAIQEAENIGKLTQLAFFFIPVTFVASIFGMSIVVCGIKTERYTADELQEFEDRLTSWIWIAASFSCLCITYGLLYRARIPWDASPVSARLKNFWDHFWEPRKVRNSAG